MGTPEQDYYQSLSPEQRERFSEILGSWKGLELSGCGDCRLPRLLNGTFDPEEASFAAGVSANQLAHYSIELNGLKRPPGQRRYDVQRLDEYDEAALFGILSRLGVGEALFEQASSDFRQCIACPSPMVVRGENPTFVEIKSRLESEQQ